MVFGSLINKQNLINTTVQNKSIQQISGDEFNISSNVTSVQGITHHPSGQIVYIISPVSNPRVHAITGSTPWDVKTMNWYAQSPQLVNTRAKGMSTSNGKRFYFADDSTNEIRMHECTTAWDITTMDANVSEVFSPGSGTLLGNWVINDEYLYTCFNNRFELYDIRNGLSNATQVYSLSVSDSPQDIVVSLDGKTVLCTDTGDNRIYEHTIYSGFRSNPTWTQKTNFFPITDVDGEAKNPRALTADRETLTNFLLGSYAYNKVFNFQII